MNRFCRPLHRGPRFIASRALGFGHTTVAAQGVAAAQTIAVTLLVDALARDPKLTGSDAHILPGLHPAEAMRARLVIVTIAIAILAVGIRLFLYPPKSEAISPDAGLDIQQMHKDKQKIPDQNWSDMSLVFDRNN